MTEVTTEIERKLAAAWKRVDDELAKAEPLLHARIDEIVREHFPEALAISLEATDQNHYGWWLRGVELADGSKLLGGDDRAGARIDELSDGLWPHLDNLGFHFLSSESHPSPFRLELGKED